jgi:peptidoglycan/LPS O-acetylase OafA/YrhL
VQAVGLTSYGVYLWQQAFTAPAKYFVHPVQIILLLPLLCPIVALSYLLIEKPAMRYGKLLSQRTRQRAIDSKAFV